MSNYGYDRPRNPLPWLLGLLAVAAVTVAAVLTILRLAGDEPQAATTAAPPPPAASSAASSSPLNPPEPETGGGAEAVTVPLPPAPQKPQPRASALRPPARAGARPANADADPAGDAAERGALAYAAVDSAEPPEDRTERLAKLFTRRSPVPDYAPPLPSDPEILEGVESWAISPTVSSVAPIGGTTADFRFLVTVDLEVFTSAGDAGGQALNDTAVYEVSVAKTGRTWRPATIGPPR